MSSDKKLILVLGATGAQGRAVVRALLKDQPDGSPSPYAVRALTRNPAGTRAQELAALGVELFQGETSVKRFTLCRFDDFEAVKRALDGCYGAWINTDGFSVGEQIEVFCGIRIFELAKQTPSLRHYVWSSLDYSLKKGGYDNKYQVDHFNGKGRVADWMTAQESTVSDTGLSWSVVTTGPYMEMLTIPMFGPLNRRQDGTFVFASSIADGHVNMIALKDLGYFARYTFDHRAETSGKNLEVASDIVGWNYLVDTFKKVTGLPAVYKRQSMDEWWENFDPKFIDMPIANELKEGKSARANFTAFWASWRDDILKRDMDWIRSIHPGVRSVEMWMNENDFAGQLTGARNLLKNGEDGKSRMLKMNKEVTEKL
ncbi:NAD(P)-binding protein [Fistulina hepatica ATCC 64428]|uniref:NAD(P)-binding protein n=1 Tax=Fistulina hepatica ATCC 64428 TaxID=1128425 RepID=A0A0D7A4N4_9AGAR|nr:NAD(P)-binding protein [Fistulina hepatica ATCC 64428]